MTKSLMAGVVQTLAALIALLVCTTTAFAQPVVQIVTQAQACGQWAEPLILTIPADRRVSIARVAELLAEDVSNTQFQAALAVASGELPFRRTSTRASRTMHATSLTSLVTSIYAGDDVQVRTALIARLREIIQRAGMNYVSLEEKRLCCFTRTASGERLCQSPTSAICEDGLPPRTVSRNRYLRAGFNDNFYAESFVAADSFDRTDWRNTPGYNFRVFLKPGRRPFTMNVVRVYDAAHHPRPAAALCRELPLLDAAPPPTDALAKEQIFSRMANLTANTIAEGDLTAAMWATQIVRYVSIRIADLAALRHAQLEIEDRNHRLQARWQEVQRVRADRDRANVLRARWQMVVIAALVISIVAIIASIFIGIRTHRKAVKREMAKFIATLEGELSAWAHLVHWSDGDTHLVLGLQPANIATQLFERDQFLEFLHTIREKTQTILDKARREAQAYSRVVLDIVGKDDLAAVLNLSTAQSENSGSVVLQGQPLTAPLAREILSKLVRHFWVVEGKCTALERANVVKDGHLKKLVQDVHTATGAKTLAEIRQLLTDAVFAALQDDEARTLKRDPTPTG